MELIMTEEVIFESTCESIKGIVTEPADGNGWTHTVSIFLCLNQDQNCAQDDVAFQRCDLADVLRVQTEIYQWLRSQYLERLSA